MDDGFDPDVPLRGRDSSELTSAQHSARRPGSGVYGDTVAITLRFESCGLELHDNVDLVQTLQDSLGVPGVSPWATWPGPRCTPQ